MTELTIFDLCENSFDDLSTLRWKYFVPAKKEPMVLADSISLRQPDATDENHEELQKCIVKMLNLHCLLKLNEKDVECQASIK